MDNIQSTDTSLNKDFSTKTVSDNLIDTTTRKQLVPEPAGPGFWKKNKWFLVLLGVGLAVLGIALALLFRGGEEAQAAQIEMSFDVSGQVQTGSDTLVKFLVENKDSNKIVSVKAEFVYPQGSTFVASEPRADNLSGTVFTLPDLPTGAKVPLFLKLKFRGAVGEKQKIVARLVYSYPNVSATFEARQETEVTLSAAGIALDIQGPKEASPNELLTYSFFYRNDTEDDFDQARLVISAPPTFKQSLAEPEPNNARLGIWDIGSVKAGQSGQVKLSGNFSGAPAGASQEWQFGFEVASSGSYVSQTSLTYGTLIKTQALVATVELINSEQSVVDPGQRVEFRVRYENNSQLVAKNVVVNVKLDSPALNLSSIQAEGATVSSSSITWNAGGLSDLQSLRPGQKGELRFSATTNNPPVKDSKKNLVINAESQIRSDEYQTFLAGNMLVVKLASIKTLEANMSHVSGALPPKVGQESIYEVSLKLTNLTNDLTGGSLTASLPLPTGSFIAESVTGVTPSSVKFDANASRITWTVGTLPAHTGDFQPAKVLTFRIRFVPSSSQASTTPTLLKDIVFKANEDFIGRAVELKAPNLTTYSGGQGTVAP